VMSYEAKHNFAKRLAHVTAILRTLLIQCPGVTKWLML